MRGIKQVGILRTGKPKAPKSKSTTRPSDAPGRCDERQAGGKLSAGEEKQDYFNLNYFENPYSVLAEIMPRRPGTRGQTIRKGGRRGVTIGASPALPVADAYRDPFDPGFSGQNRPNRTEVP